MGNCNRRLPKTQSVAMSTTSSKSTGSGISPKTTAKSKTTAKTPVTPDTGVAKETTTTAKEITGCNSSQVTSEVQEPDSVPRHLRFFSYATGTLDSIRFQPDGYIPKKAQLVGTARVLSAKSPPFVPRGYQGKPQYASSGVLQNSSAPVKKSAQPGASYSPCSSSFATKQAPSHGLVKLQGLIKMFPTYNPAYHGKQLSNGSSTQTSTSAVSVATSRTTTSPAPIKTRESIVRVDPHKKDFVIDASGLTRNRFLVDELQLIDGKYAWQPQPSSNPTNALGEIAEKNEAGKKHFWCNHHVQIIADLSLDPTAAIADDKGDDLGKGVEADVKGKGGEVAIVQNLTVVDQISKLGKDFYKHAARITIDINFPPPRDGAVAARPYGPHRIPDKDGKHNYTDYNLVFNTAEFKIIEKIVAKLDNCVGMQYLEVVLHNPSASTTVPFTVEQLFYALPFYDLRFKAWELKWQGTYMNAPIDVGHFPIMLLDKERNKWLWDKKKAAKEAEIAARKEQERIETLVYVTQSIAPEWQTASAAQPTPPGRKSKSAKQTVQNKRIL